VQLSAAIVQTH